LRAGFRSSCGPSTVGSSRPRRRRRRGEDEIRAAYEVLERWKMGGERPLSTHAARLAQSLYAQQRYVEAEDLYEISEQAGASDDIVTQMLWRQVRAKALARRGEDGAAEDLAREAVALAEPTMPST
jgi:hypothetical protein